ncbi:MULTISPECIES: hypothetical protein [unclassified Bradyrhizobium]|uniref:hypothetical protein n=1 Tax=unclassified Bradyrhizobium TaxID=2631580 RepID=UPI0028E41003|nr:MULTISPECIES: hypothetical protein [unclassified Bradyrhizobium]
MVTIHDRTGWVLLLISWSIVSLIIGSATNNFGMPTLSAARQRRERNGRSCSAAARPRMSGGGRERG